MRLVALMAGDSGAFEVAGHPYPKNLVEIDDLPLVQRVVENLKPVVDAATKAVFLVQQDEDRQFHTGEVIRLLAPEADVVAVPHLDSGAACTALHAIGRIARDEPLLVVNGDQILDVDLSYVVAGFEEQDLDAGVVTFDAVHPRWSYVRTDEEGLVVEAAEKRPISRLATAGVYWFRRGGDFVDAVMAMIRKDASVEGRFFVAPAFNELVLRGLRIGTRHIDRSQYHSLAKPRGVGGYEEVVGGSSSPAAAPRSPHEGPPPRRHDARLVRRRLRADVVPHGRRRGGGQALRRGRRRGAPRAPRRDRAHRRGVRLGPDGRSRPLAR
jgi:dTDP-glucose pyrophosphorylase